MLRSKASSGRAICLLPGQRRARKFVDVVAAEAGEDEAGRQGNEADIGPILLQKGGKIIGRRFVGG